jgi:hypothetical protein
MRVDGSCINDWDYILTIPKRYAWIAIRSGFDHQGFMRPKPLTTLLSTIHDREAPSTEPICMTRSQPSTAGSMTRILNITILISSLKPAIHGSDQFGWTGTRYLITVVHFGSHLLPPDSARRWCPLHPRTMPLPPPQIPSPAIELHPRTTLYEAELKASIEGATIPRRRALENADYNAPQPGSVWEDVAKYPASSDCLG